ncbi:MAG: HAD hydrolase-like protein [Alphaproteobacteria bacterium]|nr:HAD hydrolase-like protein [Alphaproteobacteria bacterium]
MTATGIRLVIFDMDGTLADSFPWFVRVMGSVAERFDVRRIEPDDVEELRRLDSRGLLQWLGVPRWKLPLIARHMRALKAQHIGDIRLFPGVGRMLRDLTGRGIAIAIVSSDSEANVRQTLGPENAQLVGFYACGASLFGKHAKFKKVLRKFAIGAAEAITIGDEVRDAEAAARAGIAFAAVTWGYAHIDALRAANPALILSSMDEIARI